MQGNRLGSKVINIDDHASKERDIEKRLYWENKKAENCQHIPKKIKINERKRDTKRNVH